MVFKLYEVEKLLDENANIIFQKHLFYIMKAHRFLVL